MSENTFYTWKCKVAGIEPDHIRKRKDHHSENQVLKQIVVGQARLIEARVKVYQKTATGRVQGARFLISTLRIETQGMSVRGYTNWGQTTMAKRLDRLEELKLVTREPDPADGRGSLVTLTKTGMNAVDAAMEDLLGREEDLLSALTKEEQIDLARLLSKLVNAFQ